MVDSEDKRDFRRMSVDSDITVCLLGSSHVIGITLPFHALVRIVHIEEIIPETEYAIGCIIKEMLPVTE